MELSLHKVNFDDYWIYESYLKFSLWGFNPIQCVKISVIHWSKTSKNLVSLFQRTVGQITCLIVKRELINLLQLELRYSFECSIDVTYLLDHNLSRYHNGHLHHHLRHSLVFPVV